MSQYFLFVNLDKKEYIEPRGGFTLLDLCAEPANAILPYLLADGEKDGTPLMTSTSKEWVRNEKLKSGWRVLKEGEMLNEKYWIMEKVTRFFGRWSGDRIVVAGDYGHTKLYDLVMEEGDESEWKDITEEAYKEFYEFLGFEPEEDYHDTIAEVVNAIRVKNKDMR